MQALLGIVDRPGSALPTCIAPASMHVMHHHEVLWSYGVLNLPLASALVVHQVLMLCSGSSVSWGRRGAWGGGRTARPCSAPTHAPPLCMAHGPRCPAEPTHSCNPHFRRQPDRRCSRCSRPSRESSRRCIRCKGWAMCRWGHQGSRSCRWASAIRG